MVFPMGYSLALSPPVAQNDSYKVAQNGILKISGNGVLANDTSNGKTLSALLVSNVRNGTLTLNANGSFAYVPTLNFHGTDSFRYVATDGTTISNIANVTITVTQMILSPIARNDSYMVNENSTLTVHGNGVLANDTDPNGLQMHAILLTSTINGNLVLNQNGTFTYTPNLGFHGTDSFSYEAFDGIATSNVATVTITVNQPAVQPGGNPFLVLLAQIQDLISRITGIENKISALEQQNTALDNRVSQLEQQVQKIQSNPGGTSSQGEDQGGQQDDSQNNQDIKQNNSQSNSGNSVHGNQDNLGHGNKDNPGQDKKGHGD